MEERATVRGKLSAHNRAASPLAATLRDLRNPSRPSRRELCHIPGYELLGEVGRGGMGVVYKARQVALDRVVALKMLRGGCGSRDDLTRFRSEAEAVGRLAHPGIVQIYEVGECDGQPFFSLEYVGGGSLDARLAGKPLPPFVAARLVRALALTVQHAHACGIVHRDLKPANVLLAVSDASEKGSVVERFCEASLTGATPKITDFGLAKRLDTEGTTLAGEIVGTPSYMAPEQAEGDPRSVGPACDIWALGAILYECLTGRPPFLGGTVFETIDQVRKHDPLAPHALSQGTPLDLETICLKCLQKAAGRRYGSAADLADDLGRFLDGRPIRARPVGWVERGAKWARRRPAAAALLLVSLLVVAGVAAAVPLQIAWLRERVRQTQQDAERAHELKRLADLRAACERRLAEGREALGSCQPREAERAVVCFATAQEGIDDEDAARHPDLRQLREEASRLRARASAELEKLLGAGVARDCARRFLALRDEAFFLLHHDLVGSPDPARPLASLNACRRALERFPNLVCLACAEAEKLQAARQEVLLLLAEGTARLDGGSPARLREALGLLGRVEGGPRHAVRLRRARYLGLLGERAAAQRELAAAEPPGSALDWFVRGQDRLLAGDYRAAVEEFDLALNAEHDLFWARLLRAVGLHRLGRLAEARAELGLCIRARPDFAWPYLFRAFLHRQGGQLLAAEDDLRAAELLELDEPARYALLLHRGVVASAAGRHAEAVREFQRAILTCPRYYHAYASLAEAYRLAGDRPQALAAIDQAVRLEPGRADLLRGRCRLRRDSGDLAGALADLERAVGLQPGLAADLRERARLLYLTRRYGEALPACEQALAAAPGDAAALRLRAESLLELGRPREAIAAFDLFLARGKGDAKVYRRRAKACGQVGDLAGVVADCTRALELSRDPSPRLTRGWAHLLRGAPGEAAGDFSAVLRESPADAEALLGRGAARVELNEGKAAQADLEAGLTRKPTSPRLLYHAARAYARLAARSPRGARDLEKRALALLRQAVEATPEADRDRFLREQVRRDEAFRPLRAGLDALTPPAR